MALIDELMQIERRLASGGGDVYREVLTEDALVIVPGAVLDADACAAAMDESAGWDSFTVDSERIIESPDVAVVVYRFHGVRAETDYTAVLASSYRLPERRLFLHQQTPEG
jgi:hypothetical protein